MVGPTEAPKPAQAHFRPFGIEQRGHWLIQFLSRLLQGLQAPKLFAVIPM